MSSAFSGIGHPEQCEHSMEHTFLHFYKVTGRTISGTMADMKVEYTIEKDVECNNELMLIPALHRHECQPSKLPCHFGNMTEFLNPDYEHAKHLLENAENYTYEQLEEHIIEKRKVSVIMRAYCKRHKKLCKCEQSVSVHVAGTPCVSFSRMPGRRKSRRAGADFNALHFLLWVSMRLAAMDECILHENVQDFDPSLLRRYFGSDYVVKSVLMDASNLGFPVERVRRYTWCLRKDILSARMAIPGYLDWDEAFYNMFLRELQITWKDFFGYATPEELEEQFVWAAGRPSSDMFGYTREDMLNEVPDFESFWPALSVTEKDWVEEYNRLTKGVGTVVALNQNPYSMPLMAPKSKGNQVLQTIVRNCPMYYVQDEKRWFVPKELMQFHGLPVYNSVYGEQCTMSLNRAEHNMNERNRVDMYHQTGNGMSYTQVGLALLWFHAFNGEVERERPSQSSLLRSLGSALAQQKARM